MHELPEPPGQRAHAAIPRTLASALAWRPRVPIIIELRVNGEAIAFFSEPAVWVLLVARELKQKFPERDVALVLVVGEESQTRQWE
jgi:hypothetical protein